MRFALINENEKVIVEYDRDIVRKLLVEYTKTMPVEEAFDKVVEDLKAEMLRR